MLNRVPKSIAMEPRSSRLKDRKKGEGEMLIKEQFFQDMMQNNGMLNVLGKGSSIVLLPQNALSHSFRSDTMVGFQSTTKSKLFPSLCSPDLELRSTGSNAYDESALDMKQSTKQAKGSIVNRRTFSSLFGIDISSPTPHAEQTCPESKKTSQCQQGLFSCVTCGILCFACVAIVQPTEATAQYLMSADCSILNNLGESDNDPNNIRDATGSDTNLSLGMYNMKILKEPSILYVLFTCRYQLNSCLLISCLVLEYRHFLYLQTRFLCLFTQKYWSIFISSKDAYMCFCHQG